MIKTARSIYIEAPPEKVFDFFLDPDNWTELASFWMGGEYTDIKRTPKGKGTTFSFKGSLAGVFPMNTDGELTEVVPNRRIEMKIIDPVTKAPEVTTVMFEPVGDGTTLTMLDTREPTRVERLPMVGRLAQRVMDDLGASWMPRLKKRMEAA